MSDEQPGPSSGTVDTSDHSIAHHALRKRHSPNAAASLKKEEATSVASSSGNAVKLRKVTGSAHPLGEDSSKPRHAIPSHHHRRNNELRYLKDFFPERSPQILTRSRTRQAPNNQPEKPAHAEDDAAARSPHGSLSKDKYRRYRNVPGGSSSVQKKPPDAPASSANKTETRADDAEVQESMASVLQYATEEVHRHLGEISSGMQGAAGSGLLTRADAPSSSMRFDLTGLSSTPTVIMSMPSSDHSTFHSSFAQLAAAVAGGSTEVPGTSSSAAATGSAASCTSSSVAGPSSSGRAAGSGFMTKAGVPLSFASKSQPMHRASAFLGSLVPRMQHLLGGGGMGGSGGHLHSNLRGMSILEGLRSQNEIRQSEAAGELAEMLLLGNEESLPHLPVREILQCLMALLQKAHNFELMLTAARCITNMQEALPRALPIIMDAVPLLLQKLKRIECIDVAEQSLIALEVMSRRNAKSILAAGGISATIAHVDFFSLPSQRLAFQIAANCASFITVNDFQLIRDCIPDLTQRLNVDDKRCVESICTFFNRVIENMRNNAEKLREIAGPNYDLVKNFQQLLTIQPSTVSSNTFLSILKSLRYMCTKCGDIAVALIKADFGLTVRFLLVNSDKKQANTVDVAARPPQQLREIVELIGELMPVLPKQKMFDVNPMISQYVNPNSLFRSKFAIDFVAITWHYMDQNGEWAAFGTNEAGILEQAKNTSQEIEQFDFGGQVYEVDFMRMSRRNIMTGTESRIERRIASAPVISSTKSSASAHEPDERETLKQTNNEVLLEVISMLFPLLVDIGTTSTCSSLRYESLLVMMRMIYAVESENELKKILENVPLASYIASTLSGNKGIGVVATAIQLVRVLLDKLPYLYVPLFEAEGVFHELKKLVSSKSSRRASHSSRSHKSKTHGSSSSSHHKKESTRRVPPPPATWTTNASVVVHGSTVTSDPSHSLRSHPTAPASSSSSAAPSSSTAVQAPSLPPGALTVPISNTFVPPELLLSRGMSMFQNLHHFIPSLSMANSAPFMYVGSGSMQQASSSSQAAGSSSAASSSAALRQCLTERIQEFIASEAKEIITLFTGENGVKYGATSNESVFEELCRVAAQLSIKGRDVGCEPLKTLKSILLEKDVSAFQLNHSCITTALNTYLSDSVSFHPPRKLRLKRFAAIFMTLQPDNLRPVDEDSFGSFSRLVNKVVLAIGQLEQFQVKVTNLSGISTTGVGGSSSAIASTTFLRGAQALRFFQTHQIRCNLKRHSTCNRLREWRHGRGSIKVDPFTSVSAIERYLIDRGIGLNGGGDDSSDNEDLSDEDQELSNSSTTSFSGRIEIFIGDNKLPSDISILQAIRQYALPQEDDDQETIPSSIWITAHTLYYRAVETPAEEPEPKDSAQQEPMDQDATPSTEPSGSSSTPPLRKIARVHRAGATPKKDKKVHVAMRPTIFQDGQAPKRPCPLEGYLSSKLPTTVSDPSLNCLILLRSLYGLNQYWWALFQEDDDIPPPSSHAALLPASAFHSSKLNSKVSRQLSDFLSVATQQVPAWTSDLVRAVPFAFPFMTRRNLLYCTAFGRDRALMHLVNEANGEEHEGESASRLIPRLERRKVSISRTNLIKDAQHTMTQLGSSRAMLEVGFDGEVGTGFGPTLEFYSTLSRELQKYSLKLWSGAPQKDDVDNEGEEHVHNASGLYPMIHRHSTTKQLESRLKKFEFFGRLLAQALIDSRMLDIPLSSPFFKWLLADEHTLGLHDLEMLEPGLYQSLRNIASMKSADDFEALELYFTYPGDESFELVDGGKKTALAKENMRQFIELVCYWRLVEGVRPEMEAVRKGFDLVVTNTDLLKIFTADEMEELFCGCSENDDEKVWSKSALQQALRPDHGYTHESAQIGWLVDMLQSFSKDKRRKFLQFVTGSPRLPVGGFRALNPPLTVVRKTASYGNSENELPSAMTCYNYLKIPPYATYETFMERFDVALQFIYSFHLT